MSQAIGACRSAADGRAASGTAASDVEEAAHERDRYGAGHQTRARTAARNFCSSRAGRAHALHVLPQFAAHPHTRKFGCPNHPECFLCGQSHCGRVCEHSPHSKTALRLKAEEEARACAERRAAKLAARQARRQQARQQCEAASALGEKILDAAGAGASGHGNVGVKLGAGKGLVDGASELAGDNGVPTLASFAAGFVQAVEAAERSAQGRERTGPPAVDLPGAWHAACANEVDGASLPPMARGGRRPRQWYTCCYGRRARHTECKAC